MWIKCVDFGHVIFQRKRNVLIVGLVIYQHGPNGLILGARYQRGTNGLIVELVIYQPGQNVLIVGYVIYLIGLYTSISESANTLAM